MAIKESNMYKYKNSLILRYVFLICVGVITLTSCSKVDVLSPERARKILKNMTGFELPEKAENIRAIYPFMRDPHIIIRFQTDSKGIAEVMKVFGGPDAKIKQLNEEYFEESKKEGLNPFYDEFFWQEDLGIVLNKESFKVGRLLQYDGDRTRKKAGYRIFIDDINNTVYINAWEG
jgi:hypothetical protein